MDKEEFLSALETELQVLPDENREKAMSYYRACFDSVDKISEKAIIFKLGNPKIIANNIIKEYQKSIKLKNLSGNKKKIFIFWEKLKAGNYKFNAKNIILAVVVALIFIFFILPLLGNISVVLFAVLCVIFGVILAVILLPLIVFSTGIGLVFVSIFSIWDIKNTFLPLVFGIICIISSYFIGKFMYKAIKKLYLKLKV